MIHLMKNQQPPPPPPPPPTTTTTNNNNGSHSLKLSPNWYAGYHRMLHFDAGYFMKIN